ncbi:hypothetical protein D9M69_492900 [compost metagenome]
MTIFKSACEAILCRADHVRSGRENFAVLFKALGNICDLRQRAVGQCAQRTNIGVDQASRSLEHLRCTVGIFDEAACCFNKTTIDIRQIARSSINKLAKFAV